MYSLCCETHIDSPPPIGLTSNTPQQSSECCDKPTYWWMSTSIPKAHHLLKATAHQPFISFALMTPILRLNSPTYLTVRTWIESYNSFAILTTQFFHLDVHMDTRSPYNVNRVSKCRHCKTPFSCAWSYSREEGGIVWPLYALSTNHAPVSHLPVANAGITALIIQEVTTLPLHLFKFYRLVCHSDLTNPACRTDIYAPKMHKVEVFIYGTKRRVKYQHWESQVCHTQHPQAEGPGGECSWRSRSDGALQGGAGN